MLHKRLNDLVFVSYNRKMQSRFQKRRETGGTSYDPLVLEDFDWNNEWVDTSIVHPGRDNDDYGLTWEHVDDAVGASNSLRGRHYPRQAHTNTITYQRRGTMRAQEELGEEEDVDPEDDLNVSDSDKENDAEDDGEENLAAFEDEFDDGY